MQGERNGDDEEHLAAFGEHVDIPEDCRHDINRIRNNDPELKVLDGIDDEETISSIAWELLVATLQIMISSKQLISIIFDSQMKNVKLIQIFDTVQIAEGIGSIM